MNWVNGLMDEYYGWLKAKTTITADNQRDWVAIQTPFAGLFNDLIEIYVQKNGNRIILSDNGETFHNLELNGVSLKKAGARRSIADRILLNYGVKMTQEEMVIETTEPFFAQKKHNLLSAILEMNDLYVLSKHSVSNIFKDDVRSYLDEQQIIYTPDFLSKGNTGLEFMFDFQIAGRESELVLKSFNTINKQTLTSYLFSWEDIKPVRVKATKKQVMAIAVLNDTEKPIKEEYLDALHSQNAQFILWSERNEPGSIEKLIAA